MPSTHFVTFVADTLGKLTMAIVAMQSSKDMATYLEAVGHSIEIEAINLFSQLQRWSNGGQAPLQFALSAHREGSSVAELQAATARLSGYKGLRRVMS